MVQRDRAKPVDYPFFISLRFNVRVTWDAEEVFLLSLRSRLENLSIAFGRKILPDTRRRRRLDGSSEFRCEAFDPTGGEREALKVIGTHLAFRASTSDDAKWFLAQSRICMEVQALRNPADTESWRACLLSS